VHSVTADIYYKQHDYEGALLSYLIAYGLDTSKNSIKQRITSVSSCACVKHFRLKFGQRRFCLFYGNSCKMLAFGM